jgi:hypothetical protein
MWITWFSVRVAAPREPVDRPGRVAGRPLDRGGAVVGGKPVRCGEPDDVANLAEDDGRAHVTDAEDLRERRARRSDGDGDPLAGSPPLAVEAVEFVDQVASEQVALASDGAFVSDDPQRSTDATKHLAATSVTQSGRSGRVSRAAGFGARPSLLTRTGDGRLLRPRSGIQRGRRTTSPRPQMSRTPRVPCALLSARRSTALGRY